MQGTSVIYGTDRGTAVSRLDEKNAGCESDCDEKNAVDSVAKNDGLWAINDGW